MAKFLRSAEWLGVWACLAGFVMVTVERGPGTETARTSAACG